MTDHHDVGLVSRVWWRIIIYIIPSEWPIVGPVIQRVMDHPLATCVIIWCGYQFVEKGGEMPFVGALGLAYFAFVAVLCWLGP